MDILIEEFLWIFKEYLDNMTDEEFDLLRNSTIKARTEKVKSLQEIGDFIWKQIVTY